MHAFPRCTVHPGRGVVGRAEYPGGMAADPDAPAREVAGPGDPASALRPAPPGAADVERRLTKAERPVPRPVPGGRYALAPADFSYPTETKAAFLDELAKLGNVTEAARRCGLNRTYLYVVRRREPEFAAAWDEALEVGMRVLEDVAREYAAKGCPEPVFFKGHRALDFVYDEATGEMLKDEKGEPILRPATTYRPAPNVLLKMLAAYDPRYREKTELHVKGKGALPDLDLSKLSTEELETFLALAEKARPRAGDDALDVTPQPETPSSGEGAT